MTTKKILIVVDSIDVNDSSGSKANVSLILNLREVGFKLKVYHYSRKKIHLENIKCVQIPEKKWSLLYFLSRSQRVLQRTFNINLAKFIEKIFGFSFTFFNDCNSILHSLEREKDFNPDWVLTLSKAASFRPHKAILKMPHWHSKWLAYIHDPYPMHSYPRPYDWVEPGHQFKRDFFLKIVEKSKYLVYPSKLLAEWMGGYYKNQKGKEIIIPHQIARQNVNDNLLPSYFNINNFNLFHAGNLMSTRNPIFLIKAFELFLEKNPKAKEHSHLIFVGNKSSFDNFIIEKQKKIPQLILSDGYVPFDTVITMQHNASVNIILEALGSISPFLPGKFPHCIQAKKTLLLLGPYYSECRRLLGKEYPYWSTIDNVNKIELHLTNIYLIWLKNRKNLILDRKDLIDYLSGKYLLKIINDLTE
ncbi:glycosyltransferase family protein [Lutibacter flavus]|uniref:Uncharacterized protein n=1 Tax=Lutibacter flavus TaxID=691689 RepID=A0A238VQB7_9FLAO|nr:glycosyltransferase family 1 protein [Lutibacter flavus]SNR36562.1 hypothetical protein SAMN04488111_0885 [Lutibacter flavus]